MREPTLPLRKSRQMNDVPTGSYVIDVLQGCIVSMTHECRYVALSCVWGATRQLQLTEATFEALNKAGTMHRRDLDIPGAIRDALWLFKKSTKTVFGLTAYA
jgi:hypothetical protein